MYKLIALPVILIFLASCGGNAVKMDHDQIYNILAKEEGAIAGISLGDEWSSTLEKMESENKDVFQVDADVSYGSLSIDYGDDGAHFGIDCQLEGGIITGIDILLKDLDENESGFQALNSKLSDFFTKRFPDGHENFPGGENVGYSEWRVTNSEKEIRLSMGELDHNKKFGKSSFPIGVHTQN